MDKTQSPAERTGHKPDPGAVSSIRPLAGYIARRVAGVAWWISGGTLLAWLAVWVKRRAESGDEPAFIAWVNRDLWQIWRVNHEEISRAVSAMGYTLLLVLSAIVISGGLSLWLGWKTSRAPHGRHWDLMDSMFSILGGLPLFFLAFLAENSHYEIATFFHQPVDSPGWISFVAAVAILAWGEGNASLWVRTFRRQFGRLRRAPHILAAQARGLPLTRRLSRDTAGVFVESLGSRMVLLLGGAAIVESILELDNGIGYAIIRQFARSDTSYSALAAYSLVLVVSVAVLRGLDLIARDWTRRLSAVQA